jgi:hypothetical protein
MLCSQLINIFQILADLRTTDIVRVKAHVIFLANQRLARQAKGFLD